MNWQQKNNLSQWDHVIERNRRTTDALIFPFCFLTDIHWADQVCHILCTMMPCNEASTQSHLIIMYCQQICYSHGKHLQCLNINFGLALKIAHNWLSVYIGVFVWHECSLCIHKQQNLSECVYFNILTKSGYFRSRIPIRVGLNHSSILSLCYLASKPLFHKWTETINTQCNINKILPHKYRFPNWLK